MGYFNTLTLSDAGDADDRDNELPIIYAYTRAQALADGVLIDVSDTARAAGFRAPVAITHALHLEIADIPARLQGIASYDGRLWDCLWMAFCEARRMGSASDAIVNLIMPVATHQTFQLRMVAGPGDAGELVITLMLPNES